MTSILVVEDNDDLRELIVALLQRNGYAACEAEHGLQALELMDRLDTKPALLVLDLMMPVMDGVELLEVLAHRAEYADIPVIVLSAGGRASMAPRARKFFQKPANHAELMGAVRELCGPP